ncbi:MAG: putative capsular polysaccharide synthesis family protein [Lachnospiraceae bacterium]
MIKDYELLMQYKDIIRKKKFIIWGAGKNGCLLAERLSEQTKRIEFVDSDQHKVDSYNIFPIYLPEKIKDDDPGQIAIVLSTDNLVVEKSILAQIDEMGYQKIDIYTWYAMEMVLHFLNNGDELKPQLLCNSLLEKKVDEQETFIKSMYYKQNLLEQLLLGKLAGNAVFVYQGKKVGSISIVVSAKMAGVYAIHVHSFNILGLDDRIISNIIRATSGKIISLVREPIARQVSLMWQQLGTEKNNFWRRFSSFEEVEKYFYSIPNSEDEFSWFDAEIGRILKINVFDFPFDREKGYSIIEKDGISLLLLKLEKINSLKNVIGDFLGVKNFELIYGNNAEEKGYKYIYDDYKRNVKIPYQFYDYYYRNNKYMDHFYTEDEKRNFYKRWKDRIKY